MRNSSENLVKSLGGAVAGLPSGKWNFGKTFSLPVTMIEGGLDNLDKVDAGDVDAEEPLEVVDKMGGEGVDRNEGGVLVVNVDGEDGVADGAPDDVVRDVVVVGGVMTEEKLDGVAIGMSLTLAATLGACILPMLSYCTFLHGAAEVKLEVTDEEVTGTLLVLLEAAGVDDDDDNDATLLLFEVGFELSKAGIRGSFNSLVPKMGHRSKIITRSATEPPKRFGGCTLLPIKGLAPEFAKLAGLDLSEMCCFC